MSKIAINSIFLHQSINERWYKDIFQQGAKNLTAAIKDLLPKKESAQPGAIQNAQVIKSSLAKRALFVIVGASLIVPFINLLPYVLLRAFNHFALQREENLSLKERLQKLEQQPVAIYQQPVEPQPFLQQELWQAQPPVMYQQPVEPQPFLQEALWQAQQQQIQMAQNFAQEKRALENRLSETADLLQAEQARFAYAEEQHTQLEESWNEQRSQWESALLQTQVREQEVNAALTQEVSNLENAVNLGRQQIRQLHVQINQSLSTTSTQSRSSWESMAATEAQTFANNCRVASNSIEHHKDMLLVTLFNKFMCYEGQTILMPTDQQRSAASLMRGANFVAPSNTNQSPVGPLTYISHRIKQIANQQGKDIDAILDSYRKGDLPLDRFVCELGFIKQSLEAHTAIENANQQTVSSQTIQPPVSVPASSNNTTSAQTIVPTSSRLLAEARRSGEEEMRKYTEQDRVQAPPTVRPTRSERLLSTPTTTSTVSTTIIPSGTNSTPAVAPAPMLTSTPAVVNQVATEAIQPKIRQNWSDVLRSALRSIGIASKNSTYSKSGQSTNYAFEMITQ